VKFAVELVVSLKEGLLDPQGKAVEGALPSLGWTNVSDVRVGKHIRLLVDAEDEGEAMRHVAEMAERFLSNPVIEDFRVIDVQKHRDGMDPEAQP
jgi:phosphoribosylformylglycinamidine synthase PurS subunit